MQIGHAQNSVRITQEKAAEAAQAEDASRVEEASLRRNLPCMADVQQSLVDRVAAEREKRLRLKSAARAKLRKVEESHGGLRQALGSHDREVERWQAKFNEQ